MADLNWRLKLTGVCRIAHFFSIEDVARFRESAFIAVQFGIGEHAASRLANCKMSTTLVQKN